VGKSNATGDPSQAFGRLNPQEYFMDGNIAAETAGTQMLSGTINSQRAFPMRDKRFADHGK
jgi:hypothetical protein